MPPPESLAARLERDGAVPWKEAADILRGAAEALRGLGRPHLGLEPARISLENGKVTLLPGGPAAAAYASPERARGLRDLDVRSDLYALGVIFYEMLLGMPPYVGATDDDVLRRHAESRIKFQIDEVPPGLLEIGHYLTEPDREARIPSPEGLLNALHALDPASPAPPSMAAPRRSGGRLVAAGCGCIGLVIPLLFVIGIVRRLATPERAKVVAAPPARPAPVPPRPVPPVPAPVPAPVPVPPPRPVPPVPVPPPIVPVPDAASIDAFLPRADALAAARDYERIRAEAPPGSWTLEAMAPYRLAADVVDVARAQLPKLEGRTVSLSLRNPKGQFFGRLAEVDAQGFRGPGQDPIPFERLDARAVSGLYVGAQKAKAEAMLHFAIFENDLGLAKDVAKESPPSGRAAEKYAAMLKAAEDEAAAAKRERDADAALREAQRANGAYKPEFYRDVLDFHPGTKAAEAAKAKLAELRTSVVRWGFNAGGAEGWSGEVVPGGRWNRKGFHLKGSSFEREAGFAWSPTARLRFDLKTRAAAVRVRLEGEGRTASLSLPLKPTSFWAAFDSSLQMFKSEGAWPEGAKVLKIRIDAGDAELEIDNVEVYEAGTE